MSVRFSSIRTARRMKLRAMSLPARSGCCLLLYVFHFAAFSMSAFVRKVGFRPVPPNDPTNCALAIGAAYFQVSAYP